MPALSEVLKRRRFGVTTCRICKIVFDLFKGQTHYLCPACRTPEKMARAGYGYQDIEVEVNVSEARAREAVFGRREKMVS